MKFLYSDIGKKLRVGAKVICIIGTVLSVVCAIVLWATPNYQYVRRGYTVVRSNPNVALGFVVLILGVLCSWVGTWTMYAFGQAVDDLKAIKENTDFDCVEDCCCEDPDCGCASGNEADKAPEEPKAE